jgi:hypothetical protein
LGAGLFVGGAAVLFGGTLFLRRGIREYHLTSAGKELIRAVGLAVFDNCLPGDPALRAAALDRHVANMDALLGGLPKPLRFQLAALLGALSTVAGRLALTGMITSWTDANVPQLQAALEKLRRSRLRSTQSAYHALRQLSCVSFFGDSQNWQLAGYTGQIDV